MGAMSVEGYILRAHTLTYSVRRLRLERYRQVRYHGLYHDHLRGGLMTTR